MTHSKSKYLFLAHRLSGATRARRTAGRTLRVAQTGLVCGRVEGLRSGPLLSPSLRLQPVLDAVRRPGGFGPRA